MEERKNNGFKKGCIPWNKGVVGMPSESNKTKFAVGHKKTFTRPIGYERPDNCGAIFRKVNNTGIKKLDWRQVHNLVWEALNGKIPEGYVITFKDKNPKNNKIDNLECISRKELMMKNSIGRYPKELVSAILLAASLNKKIKRRINEKNDR